MWARYPCRQSPPRDDVGAIAPPQVSLSRKEDVRLPGKRSSNSHGARLVHLIITIVDSDHQVVNEERSLSPCHDRVESWR